MACVTQILDRGAEWFQSMGVPKDPNNPRDGGSYGPKLYSISGHVNNPRLVELPLGITARDLIDKHAGGVWKGRQAKAVVPGGISMGFLSGSELDTPLDFNGPGKVGCLGLGTAAVVVIDDQTSMVDVLYNACRFFAHESCGQCTPCREGTSWSMKILARIRQGKGSLKDLDTLADIGNTIGVIPGTTICGLADGAAWPIKNALKKFRPEFEEYIKSGRRSDAREAVGAH
jgi:NADH-quinone oxidoreductase subunit F